ncbi:MAG: hypothetical protein HYU64_10110 [Armatimonadetes bacterium]|nr:hypothetical protein [Armatimonadota bacterium]
MKRIVQIAMAVILLNLLPACAPEKKPETKMPETGLTETPTTESRTTSKKKFPQDKGPTKINMSGYPEQYKEGHELFMGKCKKCHTIARPIWSKFQGEQWDAYTRKMMRKPGCPVTPEDQPKISEFLKYDHKVREKEIGEFWKKLEGK